MGPPPTYQTQEEKEAAYQEWLAAEKATRKSQVGVTVVTKTREQIERDGPEFELRERGRKLREQKDREAGVK